MSGLVWIYTDSDGFPDERIFQKSLILKKINNRQKRMQNFPGGKELSIENKKVQINQHIHDVVFVCLILNSPVNNFQLC